MAKTTTSIGSVGAMPGDLGCRRALSQSHCLQLDPPPARVFFGQGLQPRRYAEAEAAFSEAMKLRPDFAHAANNLGFVYYKQGRREEAVRWFENTIRMDPSRAIAYYNLGDACVDLGQKDKARKAYQTYLELAPKSSNAARVRETLDQL